MQHEFRNRFACEMKDDQFVFIDNTVPDMDDEELEDREIEEFVKALYYIIDFTVDHDPFFCDDIKEALKEKDAL
jgi:hypothetical protein